MGSEEIEKIIREYVRNTIIDGIIRKTNFNIITDILLGKFKGDALDLLINKLGEFINDFSYNNFQNHLPAIIGYAMNYGYQLGIDRVEIDKIREELERKKASDSMII